MLAIGGVTDPSADTEDLFEMIVEGLVKKYGPKEVVLTFSIEVLNVLRISKLRGKRLVNFF